MPGEKRHLNGNDMSELDPEKVVTFLNIITHYGSRITKEGGDGLWL